MLNTLHSIENMLPELLQKKDIWNSLYIDYYPPIVERVWTQIGDTRIYLHKIYPCKKNEALFHTHPWPSAMRIVKGSYEMMVGYSKDWIEPPTAAKIILSQNSQYEMTNIDGWHSVRPVDKPALTLMVTGKPWGKQSPKSPTPLRPLSNEVKINLLNQFKKFYE